MFGIFSASKLLSSEPGVLFIISIYSLSNNPSLIIFFSFIAPKFFSGPMSIISPNPQVSILIIAYMFSLPVLRIYCSLPLSSYSSLSKNTRSIGLLTLFNLRYLATSIKILTPEVLSFAPQLPSILS